MPKTSCPPLVLGAVTSWVTCPWPPEYLDVLAWQWDKKVAPYWTKRAKFAEDHGVKIAIEMHPGFVAYSPETLLRLRGIAGKAIGCNYDPSHMFWQSIDPIAAIARVARAHHSMSDEPIVVGGIAEMAGQALCGTRRRLFGRVEPCCEVLAVTGA